VIRPIFTTTSSPVRSKCARNQPVQQGTAQQTPLPQAGRASTPPSGPETVCSAVSVDHSHRQLVLTDERVRCRNSVFETSAAEVLQTLPDGQPPPADPLVSRPFSSYSAAATKTLCIRHEPRRSRIGIITMRSSSTGLVHHHHQFIIISSSSSVHHH
jgi:hypothetical protein